MRVLQAVTPTPEQLKIVSRSGVGVEVIRGAAGSGKTTTAILRLRGLTGLFLNRRKNTNSREPVKALILTFNRTLRGYIGQLAEERAVLSEQVDLQVDTFARWACDLLRNPPLADDVARRAKIRHLGSRIRLDSDFLCNEVEYIRARFTPNNLNDYLTARREGRGVWPRVEREMRKQILEEVIYPYNQWKSEKGVNDWTDLAISLAARRLGSGYDIIVVDETQDFAANQVRAILRQAADESALTFILDSAQRIYPHAFTWAETGINVTANNSHRLERNYRNTVEIAAFAAPLVEGITAGDADATIPDLNSCTSQGEVPVVLVGRFNAQLKYAIDRIQNSIDLSQESVAFLHPKGEGWFQTTRNALLTSSLPYVEITRRADWPEGKENIALSTIHSAKGLEFDHVFMLGLNAEILSHGPEQGDDSESQLRRLLAMGITRARKTVILGYNETDRSDLMDLLDSNTYREIRL